MRLDQQLRDLVEAAPAFAALEEALSRGDRAVGAGLPGGARPVLLAALAARRPLLVVLPTRDRLPLLADDLEGLLPADREVLQNPSLDLFEEEEPELGSGTLIGQRLRLLQSLRGSWGGSPGEAPTIILTGASALLQKLPAPSRGSVGTIELRVGSEVDVHDLARKLVDVGCERVPVVEAPGEFAVRGGILDIFPLGAATPVRIELFGDEVESLRLFEPGSQRSIGEVERYPLTLLRAADYRTLRRQDGATLLDHLPPEAAVVVVRPGRCRERLEETRARFPDHATDLHELARLDAALGQHPLLLLGDDAADDPLAAGAAEVAFPFAPAELLTGRELQSVTNELARLVQRGERVTVACPNEAERERLTELFEKSGLTAERGEGLRTADDAPGLTLVPWSLGSGFRYPERGVSVLASHRLFARHRRRETASGRSRSRRGGAGTAVESFADLEAGVPVVHVSYGIALFQGIVRRERDGQPRDFLRLEFDGGELFIPTDRIGLIRRYVGPTGKVPRLSKIGGKGWQKKTKKAQEAVRDLAAELLEVQAERALRPGHAFPPDDRWQVLFEESFPYTDTDDQIRITAEVKRDMETARAMDRLVCGDVGYGKTEIAVRAAFKCANAGRQVAVLVPTTVLAHQHHRTFSERMAGYPLRVEVLSRFRSAAEQRQVVKACVAGAVDVVIGTHRLLSQDVAFKDLGLVIVDEEQRFGVAHKERLKALRRTVDLLTLTATPIPRTLHMALSGARDISVLQTPPPGRTAVETKLVRFSKPFIRRAIERELARDGQVFFVHDRVRSIEAVARMIRELVPTARVLVVHGQMPEHHIEERMLAFVEHEADVLVATTLIENGLDIRRANTLVVDRAHNYGLGELHQLRGRVGRSDVRAFAYMVLPEHGGISDVALRRLRAIEEFSDLGAGFQIALRDLEIRGAGNVLGAAQSGHIADVGYDLYCRLLKRAVAELRGELQEKSLDLERDLDLEAGEVELVLDVPAYVPDAYVQDVPLKIECYRKLASAVRETELDALEEELRDRFGPLPHVLENLFKLRRARIRAAGHGVLKITRQDRVLQLRCRQLQRLERGIRARRSALRRIDSHMLYLVMPDPEADDEVQLDLLLEVLAPLDDDDARSAIDKAAELDPTKLRAERQRRLRARAHRDTTPKPARSSSAARPRRRRKKTGDRAR